MSDSDLWYGRGDIGTIVFDKTIQLNDGSALLYVLEKNDVEKYVAEEIFPMLQEEINKVITNKLSKKYTSWKTFYSSRLKKLEHMEPYSFQKIKAQAEQEHKKKLQQLGIPFQGVIYNSKRSHRTTHCWSCKDKLNSSIDLECNACGWILCKCGACGCGYG